MGLPRYQLESLYGPTVPLPWGAFFNAPFANPTVSLPWKATTPTMTRERFTEILKEYDYTDAQIDILWQTRPRDMELDETRVRETAAHFQYTKDTLTQA